MMELKVCALVISLISSVIANPYGYGVKGVAGASAKAVAGASAGTYGGVAPIPVPFGNGYSGSFTKSSSSSSSSSSASSSSSSSSFAYSGHLPGVIAGLESTGSVGCTSGLCQNLGVKDISGNLGVTDVSAGVQGYNTANTAAAAGSGSETNCRGPTCMFNSEKCISGHCATNPQIETLPKGHDANQKCSSGQCDDNLNDIHVVGHPSNTPYGSKDQSASGQKAPEYSANSNCHGYSCSTTTTFESQPDSAHQSTNLPRKQLPATSNYEASNGYKSPSIHLETPKEDSICNNGNCNTEYSKPRNDYSPSSYIVPIHGTYDSNNQKPECQDEKCGNSEKGSYSNVGNSYFSNSLNSQASQSLKGSYYPSSPSCSGSNCGSVPSGYIGVTPTSAFTSNQYPLPSTFIGSAKCNSPSCNPRLVGPTAFNMPPGYTNDAVPVNTISTPNQKVPIYTSGFGAPGGVLSVNPSTPLHKEPTNGNSVTGCDSQNCFGQASSPHEQPTLSGNKPNEDSKSPIYTGGFGASPGLLKPDDYDTPVSSKPIQPISPIHNTPSSVTFGCETGNCFGNSKTVATTATQSGSYGNHKEIESSNLYTGGYGGPAGVFKPNEFDVKVITKPEYSTTPSYNSHPMLPATADCESPYCIENAAVAGGVTGSSTQFGPNGLPKPNIVIDTSSEVPLYTGGFGGPAGLLKPNEYELPHKTPGHFANHPVTSQNKIPAYDNSVGCSTPNCSPPSVVTNIATNTQSPFTVTKPITLPQSRYTSNYGQPVGVTYPSPIAVAPITTPVTNTQPPPISCSGSNCDSVQPGTSSDQPSTTPSSNSTNCNSPSCNLNAPNVQHGQTNYTVPVDKFSIPTQVVQGSTTLQKEPTYESASTGCSSPNCFKKGSLVGTPEPTMFSSNLPNEGTKLQMYSGGFGAPTGLLKPNDYKSSKINKPIQSDSLIQSSNTPSSITGCKTGKCFGSSNIASTVPTTATQTGTYGNQKENENSNIYTGGFGGPAGMLKPNEYDIKVTTKPAYLTTPSYNSHPTVPATADCKTPNCIGNAAVAGTVTGSSTQSGANGVQPNFVIELSSNLPLYTGGFEGPAGLLKPNEHDLARKTPVRYPSLPVKSQNEIPANINVAGCSTPDCSYTDGITLVTSTPLPSTSCSYSNCDSVLSDISSDKPSTNTPSGSDNCNSPNCNPTASSVEYGQNNNVALINKVSTLMQPSTTLQQGPIFGSASTGCSLPNCFSQVPLSSILEPPTFSAKHSNEAAKLPIYSGGFDASPGLFNSNKYAVFDSGISKPKHNAPVSTMCKIGNCSSNIAGNTSTTQLDSYGIPKNNDSENNTSGYSALTEQAKSNKSQSGAFTGSRAHAELNSVNKPNIVLDSHTELPPNTGGLKAPHNEFEALHNASNRYPNYSEESPNKITTNTNSASCSTPNCSTPSLVTNIITNTQSSFAVTKPINLPQFGYTSNYGRPIGVTYPSPIAVAPITLSTALPLLPTSTNNINCKTADCATYLANELSNKQPSSVSSSTNCQSSDCSKLSSTIAGSNPAVSSNANSKQNLPVYTSGFGAPPGLLNPYDVSIPAGNLKPNEHTKPAGTAASPGCTSSYCDSKPPSSSSLSHNLATSLSSSHASASSSASAVAYTGGFGGPPGILKPYDNDKTHVENNYGKSQINSPHDNKSGTHSSGSLLNSGSASQIGDQSNFDTLAGSTAGSYSGSTAVSNAGPSGYIQHGPYPAGNSVKIAGPCGGGCDGYQDSVTGRGNSAAAVAKSLSSSGSYGHGGSFAGSSSSAHSSAGSYIKGGYGKR